MNRTYDLVFPLHLAPLQEHALTSVSEQYAVEQTNHESHNDVLISGAALIGVFALVAYASKPKHTHTLEQHQENALNYAGRKSFEARELRREQKNLA